MSHLQLSEFQATACQVALNKLFKGRMFDICAVRDLAAVLQAPLGGQDFEALRLFHCIEYGQMTPKVRQQVQDMTLKVLGLEMPIAEVVSEVAESKSTTFARWLLGVKK